MLCIWTNGGAKLIQSKTYQRISGYIIKQVAIFMCCCEAQILSSLWIIFCELRRDECFFRQCILIEISCNDFIMEFYVSIYFLCVFWRGQKDYISMWAFNWKLKTIEVLSLTGSRTLSFLKGFFFPSSVILWPTKSIWQYASLPDCFNKKKFIYQREKIYTGLFVLLS